MTIPDERQRLADWRALCAWLEDRPYNASYRPRCQGDYLLSVGHLDARTYGDTDEIKAINRQTRFITAERQRMGVVYWASGYGWRLRKNYQERLDAEQARIDAAHHESEPT